jgi:hypothetical protein
LSEIVAKNEMRTLVEEATSMATANGLPLDKLRGVALYNPKRDAPLTSLGSFDAATKEVTRIPNFIERFGREEVRIVLQFVYQYFARVDSVQYQEAAFEGLWCDFVAEILDACWVTRGVANLSNFNSDALLLDLGDGITIRGRNPDDLATRQRHATPPTLACRCATN